MSVSLLEASVTLTIFASVTGVVMGVLKLYNAVPQLTALWTQVGVFAGITCFGGLAVSQSDKVQKWNVLSAVVSLLVLPALLGGLGALNYISAYNMLWIAASICGVVVLYGICNIGKITKDGLCK